MHTHADKTQERKSHSVSVAVSQKQSIGRSALQFVDNRPEAIVQKKIIKEANNSSTVSQLRVLKGLVQNGSKTREALQLQTMTDRFSHKQKTIQNKNSTGLPDNVKSGVESLSGMDMSDVRVHRNSAKPASVQAHAYTQGSDIHVASGQEKHLPHEAWHVVQQKQGRVRPTVSVNGMAVNDNLSLEKEADVMGEKAAQFIGYTTM